MVKMAKLRRIMARGIKRRAALEEVRHSRCRKGLRDQELPENLKR